MKTLLVLSLLLIASFLGVVVVEASAYRPQLVYLGEGTDYDPSREDHISVEYFASRHGLGFTYERWGDEYEVPIVMAGRDGRRAAIRSINEGEVGMIFYDVDAPDGWGLGRADLVRSVQRRRTSIVFYDPSSEPDAETMAQCLGPIIDQSGILSLNVYDADMFQEALKSIERVIHSFIPGRSKVYLAVFEPPKRSLSPQRLERSFASAELI